MINLAYPVIFLIQWLIPNSQLGYLGCHPNSFFSFLLLDLAERTAAAIGSLPFTNEAINVGICQGFFKLRDFVKNHVKITKNEHEEVSHPIIKLT